MSKFRFQPKTSGAKWCTPSLQELTVIWDSAASELKAATYSLARLQNALPSMGSTAEAKEYWEKVKASEAQVARYNHASSDTPNNISSEWINSQAAHHQITANYWQALAAREDDNMSKLYDAHVKQCKQQEVVIQEASNRLNTAERNIRDFTAATNSTEV